MTISLTIDTATAQTIVGLLDGDAVIFHEVHIGATDHGRAVSDLVARALAAGPAPDQVIVGMGPGPFTGLRVGIAFAQSFALAREIPVIGICSLDAIDIQVEIDHEDYIAAIDARRKEIYWARYQGGKRVEGPSVSKPDEVEGFIIDQYPSPAKMVELAKGENFTEPLYLRRPDAVATVDR
jgi:tRNA threonylcarbamoyl adenosine modification protein YeaZ